jgi:D123
MRNTIQFLINESLLIPADTVDVYIDRKKRVWIVDFNPFGEPSTALLFEWAELLLLSPTKTDLTDAGSCNQEILTEPKDRPHNTEIDFEFRIINHQRETFSSTSGTYRGPIDVTLAPDFHKFMEICKNQDKEEAAECRDVHVL